MKTKIKEVQDYFKAKIIAGDYEIEKFYKNETVLKIDNEYSFCFWTNNGPGFFALSSFAPSFMYIELNAEERVNAFKVLEPILRKNFDENLRPQKEIQYQQLKKDLGYDN